MWKRSLAVLPGIGVSLLPKLACPLCWPAYAGLLSALGLGFLISAKYLLPLTVAFLAIAVKVERLAEGYELLGVEVFDESSLPKKAGPRYIEKGGRYCQ